MTKGRDTIYQGWVFSENDLDVCYYPTTGHPVGGWQDFSISLDPQAEKWCVEVSIFNSTKIVSAYRTLFLNLAQHFKDPKNPVDIELLSLQIEYGLPSLIDEGVKLFIDNFSEFWV